MSMYDQDNKFDASFEYNNNNLSILPPTSDYVFCNLFGVEENKDCLMSLLNAILRGKPHVYNLTLRPTECRKMSEDGKSIRADILVDVNDKTIINMEMQCSSLRNSIDRMLFYHAIQRSRSIADGDDYRIMPHIISIWILTDTMYPDLDHCMHEIKMALHTNEGVYIRAASEKERIIIIELNKLSQYIEHLRQEQAQSGIDINDDTQVKLDQFASWMTFIINPLKISSNYQDDDNTIHKALEKLHGMSNDPHIRAEYNFMMKMKSDMTMNYNDGKEEGIKEGIEIGHEIGIKEGEKKKAVEMVRKMISKGFDIEDIIECSGLTEFDIENLKQGA